MAAQDASQAEIWDDSALIDSWNEALDEYKKYHSIAARGESMEDVVKSAVEPVNGTSSEQRVTESEPIVSDWQPVDHTADAANVTQASETTLPNAPAATVPQELLSTVPDEGMKNLMMAWYYAGYYTGLAEGQQRAAAH